MGQRPLNSMRRPVRLDGPPGRGIPLPVHRRCHSRYGPRPYTLQKRTFDTPLNPRGLSNEPGPANRRSGAYRTGLTPGTACRTHHASHT
jgi:hypothetical protein